MAGSEHWNDRYEAAGDTSVSWFEATPQVSMNLLDALDVNPADSVIDVGGGASQLVDHLIDRGHRDLTVLDISGVALDHARRRVAESVTVQWIERDLLAWEPSRRRTVWHDRAVLHFLVDEADRATYLALMRRALEPGGAFVIGVFAEDGPTQCSMLPVHRYAPGELVDLLGDIDVVAERRQVHRTPTGVVQPFNWLAGRLRG